MPGSPRPGECANFHPHADEFGGGEVVLKVLDWLVQTGNFNAWTLNGRTLVQFMFNGKPSILIYGTGNPTMFIPENGTDYVRSQTSGMNKINGQKGLDAVKGHVGNCLRTSYAQSLVPATVSATATSVAIPASEIKTLATLLGALFLGVIVLFGGLRLRTA